MLSPDDLAVLDFEASAPRGLGAKEEAIRTQLGLTPVRYYQRLNVLLDSPDALAQRPQLIRRLQRLRDAHVPPID
ncbi:DUF3263 domain-containing protein [Corynebacterium capitovis]|uniref:DUF3263 domain-containing protein n=1 Tax=Corynebacterium capitovis TaxID=131081 RepID=UPI0003616F24|nr:DUF3263 domain-containing protein [Corynebacterium capitovis]